MGDDRRDTDSDDVSLRTASASSAPQASTLPTKLRRVLFGCFVLSGFTGLVYQIVWVRLALASFGVITPFVSVVVSVFMLGLGVGSWAGGRWASRVTAASGLSAIALYGFAECTIAAGALLLPELFAIGRSWLLPYGELDSAPARMSRRRFVPAAVPSLIHGSRPLVASVAAKNSRPFW